MLKIVIAVTLVLAFVGSLGSCGLEPLPIETPPVLSDDPADAFPQFDRAYRNAGHMAGEQSTFKGRLVVRHLRFFEDGTVRDLDVMTDYSREVTRKMSAKAFSDMSSSDPTGILSGRYLIEGDAITISVGRDNVYEGRAWRTQSVYKGKITGDQLQLGRFDPETDQRMSPDFAYWRARR